MRASSPGDRGGQWPACAVNRLTLRITTSIVQFNPDINVSVFQSGRLPIRQRLPRPAGECRNPVGTHSCCYKESFFRLGFHPSVRERYIPLLTTCRACLCRSKQGGRPALLPGLSWNDGTRTAREGESSCQERVVRSILFLPLFIFFFVRRI